MTNTAPKIRPDFDTDVLWKPPLANRKVSRGGSIDSQDSQDGRRISVSEMGVTSPPIINVPVETRTRRMSFTEMIFGSPGSGGRGFSWGERSYRPDDGSKPASSVTEDERFREIMRHQNKILNDDGGLSGFHRADYQKK